MSAKAGPGITPRITNSPARSSAGFMLLEVLVAFAIAALAVGVLFHAGTSGLRLALFTSRYEEAVARAQSHLAIAVHAVPLEAGDWQGDDGGGYVWHLNVVPIASTSIHSVSALARRGSTDVGLTLWSVTVRIGWRDGSGLRQVRLATERVGEAAR
jgi:general secretion pathway protein I